MGAQTGELTSIRGTSESGANWIIETAAADYMMRNFTPSGLVDVPVLIAEAFERRTGVAQPTVGP